MALITVRLANIWDFAYNGLTSGLAIFAVFRLLLLMVNKLAGIWDRKTATWIQEGLEVQRLRENMRTHHILTSQLSFYMDKDILKIKSQVIGMTKIYSTMTTLSLSFDEYILKCPWLEDDLTAIQINLFVNMAKFSGIPAKLIVIEGHHENVYLESRVRKMGLVYRLPRAK